MGAEYVDAIWLAHANILDSQKAGKHRKSIRKHVQYKSLYTNSVDTADNLHYFGNSSNASFSDISQGPTLQANPAKDSILESVMLTVCCTLHLFVLTKQMFVLCKGKLSNTERDHIKKASSDKG